MYNAKWASFSIHRDVADELDSWRRELEDTYGHRVNLSDVLKIALNHVRGNAAQIVREQKTIESS
jgi:hypothetical protein